MASISSSSRLCAKRSLALCAMLVFLAGVTPRPAAADGAASTRNIILGAAAIAAAVIINNNIQHKRLAHDTVVGYTRNGGTVYADGRIVYPNGDVLYTSNGDRRVCGWYGGYEPCGPRAVAYYPGAAAYYPRAAAYYPRAAAHYPHAVAYYPRAVAYYPRGWRRHDRGHHYGWYKHHPDHDRDGDDRND